MEPPSKIQSKYQGFWIGLKNEIIPFVFSLSFLGVSI
jgi:hypothetical protein